LASKAGALGRSSKKGKMSKTARGNKGDDLKIKKTWRKIKRRRGECLRKGRRGTEEDFKKRGRKEGAQGRTHQVLRCLRPSRKKG